MNTDVNKFAELGYVVIKDFLSPLEHFQLNKLCEQLTKEGCSLANDSGDWILNSPYNPCKLDRAIATQDIFKHITHTNPKLLEVARSILGEQELCTYISKFFPMIPKEGFSVDWHQDNLYIGASPTKLISCDIFVNGADKENGCLRIIPGSQERSYPHVHYPEKHFLWIETISDDDPDIVDVEMNEPFAIFFHSHLVHTCYRNTSDRYRPSLAWEYMVKGYVPETYDGHQSQDLLEII